MCRDSSSDAARYLIRSPRRNGDRLPSGFATHGNFQTFEKTKLANLFHHILGKFASCSTSTFFLACPSLYTTYSQRPDFGLIHKHAVIPLLPVL